MAILLEIDSFALKDHADEDLERAIQSVAAGKPYFSPTIAQALLEDYVNLMRERRVQDSYDLLGNASVKCCSYWREASPTKRLLPC